MNQAIDLSVPRVVLLGTGTPNVTPGRAGPCVAVVIGEVAYLVDCGAGVVHRAEEAYRRGIAALCPAKLTTLFLTHLHSDHTVGYSDLILTPWVLGRDVPLRTYGPPGTRAMTVHLLTAYWDDIRQRVDGLEPANDRGNRVDVTEIRGTGLVYRDRLVRVEAFAVHHGSWPAFGYRFRTAERTIVISGDTAPAPDLIAYYRGADVLVHEVYAARRFEQRPSRWQRYHHAMHTSTRELAALAAQARPGLLVLYHQLYWGADDEELLAEIREAYDGPVVSGHDLEIY